jgi:anaerobic selenocysteine-containing dehydrogenase
MLRVIITEELYDHDFVTNGAPVSPGFATGQEASSLSTAAEITGIRAGDISGPALSLR